MHFLPKMIPGGAGEWPGMWRKRVASGLSQAIFRDDDFYADFVA